MKLRGEFYIVLSAIGFSLMPVFAKTAYKGGTDVTTVLFFRFLFALVFIWAYIFIKKLDFRIKRKQILMLFILGSILYSGSAISLFNAYRFISAGLAQVLIYTYPVWVLVIAVLLFKDKIRAYKIYAIVLSMIGTTLVAYSPGQKFSAIGVILALIGALSYALYVAFIDNGEFKDIHPVVMTGYILLAAAVTFALYGTIRGELTITISSAGWLSIALLAFFSTSVAILAFCSGAKIIGSGRAAIVSTIEPIATFIFGFIFLGEKVTYNMIFGGAVIIMAIVSINVFKDKEEQLR